jgi:hypothetical protein
LKLDHLIACLRVRSHTSLNFDIQAGREWKRCNLTSCRFQEVKALNVAPLKRKPHPSVYLEDFTILRLELRKRRQDFRQGSRTNLRDKINTTAFKKLALFLKVIDFWG